MSPNLGRSCFEVLPNGVNCGLRPPHGELRRRRASARSVLFTSAVPVRLEPGRFTGRLTRGLLTGASRRGSPTRRQRADAMPARPQRTVVHQVLRDCCTSRRHPTMAITTDTATNDRERRREQSEAQARTRLRRTRTCLRWVRRTLEQRRRAPHPLGPRARARVRHRQRRLPVAVSPSGPVRTRRRSPAAPASRRDPRSSRRCRQQQALP